MGRAGLPSSQGEEEKGWFSFPRVPTARGSWTRKGTARLQVWRPKGTKLVTGEGRAMDGRQPAFSPLCSLTWPCPSPRLGSGPPLAPPASQMRSGPGAATRSPRCEARGTPPGGTGDRDMLSGQRGHPELWGGVQVAGQGSRQRLGVSHAVVQEERDPVRGIVQEQQALQEAGQKRGGLFHKHG